MRNLLAVARNLFVALVVVIFIGACTYVPVKEVKKCAKVVDVQMMRGYFLGIFPDADYTISPYLVLDNGKRLEVSTFGYGKWGDDLLETIKKERVGKNYCRIEYEKVK